jgi:DNA-binding CsgD family transcriptional regulator
MTLLSADDYHAGLRVVQQLAASSDSEQFARRGVQLLGELVASELTTLSVCDLVSGRRRVVSSPGGAISAADRAAFDRHFSEHPLVRHHAVEHGRDAHRISDSIPFVRFRHSALYTDYYRRVGIDHVIAMPLHVDDRLLVSFVLNRKGRDFSDREREQLDSLTASLGELYRHTVALDRARSAMRGFDELLHSTRIGTIRLGPRGEVRDFSPRAAEQLQRLWGARLKRGTELPPELSAYLARPLRCASIASTLPLLARSTFDGRLAVRTYPAIDSTGGLFVLLDETTSAAETPALDRWSLSARQKQILHWVAAGKTDRDIGAILGISARTVGKHLQRIYDKLGVETRTAAVTRLRGET